MAEQALELANLLLREGVLDLQRKDHTEAYQTLLTNKILYEEVKERLHAVGYELVQFLGHMGIKVSSEATSTLGSKNLMGLHAGHIRMIIYLWVHLVYREWVDLRSDRPTCPPGMEQSLLFDVGGKELYISYKEVFSTFQETLAKTTIKGIFTKLRQLRFIRFSEREDRIWAAPALYIMIDRQRMEDFVVGLARSLGAASPEAAVTQVSTGTIAPPPEADDEKESSQ